MPVLPELVPMLDRIAQARAHMPDASTPVAERRAIIHRGMDQRAKAVVLPMPPGTRADHEVPVEGGTITVRVYRPDLAASCPATSTSTEAAGGSGSSTTGTPCAPGSRPTPAARWSPWRTGCPLSTAFPGPSTTAGTLSGGSPGNAGRLGVDAARLSIGGDSSGANLAAATALMVRDQGGPALVAQVLEIPALDLTLGQPSVNEPAEAVLLTRDDLAADIERYCDPGDRTDPYASPLLAEDLSGLPPALIMTAEFDILRDDGAAYGRRLTAAGVPAEVVQWDGHVHGSHEMTAMLESARRWQAHVAEFLTRV